MKSILLFSLISVQLLFSDEINYIAFKGNEQIPFLTIGPSVDEKDSPCCTFNIALSAIGYDCNILHSEDEPIWDCDNTIEPATDCQSALSPKTWFTTSALWYSKLLIHKITLPILQQYLKNLNYGNQNLSGDHGKENGFLTAHIMSSLKISPREQAYFIQQLIADKLPISTYAMHITKRLLYIKTFHTGWKLFGKTGSGISVNEKNKIAWYVGWLEKDGATYSFALCIKDFETFPTKEERQDIVLAFFQQAGIPIDEPSC